MSARGILVAWVAVATAWVLLLGYALTQWRAVSSEGMRAAAERERLTGEIRLRDQQLVAEMRAHAGLLQDMQWSAGAGDPSTFLGRLAELARERHVTVLSIGPLERQATPQYTKSWHTIQIAAPYREIRDLAARIEQDRGIIEDVRLEAAPAVPGRPASPGAPTEVQARFRIAALELSPQARKVLDRAVAASGSVANPAARDPIAASSMRAEETSISRDPFAFVSRPVPARSAESAPPPATPALPAPPPREAVPLELSAILGSPGGHLAIVNNQVVKVGDEVAGHRVEEIGETSVVVREPGAPPRTLELPELGAAPPAPRR